MEPIQGIPPTGGAVRVDRSTAEARNEEVRARERARPATAEAAHISLSRGADRYAIAQDVVRETERADPLGTDAEPPREAAAQPRSLAARDELRDLRQTDQAVRAQQAIANPADAIVGLPMFDYRIGPDGRAYAMGEGVKLALELSAMPELLPADEPPTLALEPDSERARSPEELGLARATGPPPSGEASALASSESPTTLPESRPSDLEAAERGVRAYADATQLVRAPSGTGGDLLEETA